MPLVKRYRPGPFPQFTNADDNLRGYLRDEFNRIALFSNDTGVAVDNAREVLIENRGYFVRKDGNDANSGLANTASGAFLTIQKAVDVAAALDLSIYGVQINVDGSAGVYDEQVTLKSYVGKGPIALVTSNGAHIQRSNGGGARDCINAGAVIGQYNIAGFKLTALTPGYNCVRATDAFTLLQLQNIEFGSANIHVSAQFNATVRNIGPTLISSGANFHYVADTGATIVDAGTATTLTGTPAFAFAYCRIIQQARFICNTAVGVTPFTGSAAGARWSLDTLGMIFTGGQGKNFLPGNVDQSGDIPGSGAQYV